MTSLLLPSNFNVGTDKRKFKIPFTSLKGRLSVTVSLSPEHVMGRLSLDWVLVALPGSFFD